MISCHCRRASYNYLERYIIVRFVVYKINKNYFGFQQIGDVEMFYLNNIINTPIRLLILAAR